MYYSSVEKWALDERWAPLRLYSFFDEVASSLYCTRLVGSHVRLLNEPFLVEMKQRSEVGALSIMNHNDNEF